MANYDLTLIEAAAMPRDEVFNAPTIISGVTQDIPIAGEEVFAPVLSVLTFKTIEEAISLVNDAAYGLFSVWSENIHICIKFACRAHAGIVWSNTRMGRFCRVTLWWCEGKWPGLRKWSGLRACLEECPGGHTCTHLGLMRI